MLKFSWKLCYPDSLKTACLLYRLVSLSNRTVRLLLLISGWFSSWFSCFLQYNIQTSIIFEAIRIFQKNFQRLLIYLSPTNPEILVKKSLLVVEKLHFVRWDIFFEPPCICLLPDCPSRLTSDWTPHCLRLARGVVPLLKQRSHCHRVVPQFPSC